MSSEQFDRQKNGVPITPCSLSCLESYLHISCPLLHVPPSLQNVTSFIIDTKHPGNVASATKGMKTMDFSELILVTPRDDRVKFIDGASGAVDVLEGAK